MVFHFAFLILNFIFISLSWARDPKVGILEKAPLVSFDPPEIRTHTFSNGMKLYFLENRELPVFQMSALVKVGPIYEPPDKKGLTTLMMSGIRTGGTRTLSGDKIDRELEQKAMSLSVSTEKEYAEMQIRSLAGQIPQAISLFFELLKGPRFDSEKIEIVRKQMLDEISRRNEDPMDVARREYAEQLYGTENVWARQPTAETVGAITRDDIIGYYHRTVVPNHILLAVSGHMEFKTLVSFIADWIKDWPARDVRLPEIAPVNKEWKAGVWFIDQPINQSSLAMGHFGERRWNEDKYALTLANYIFGGSTFGSRLGTQIRTNLGLAYSTASFFTFGTDYGEYEIVASTKSASTVRVVREVRKIMEDIIKKNPVTRQELDNAKETILNQLVFEYDNLSKIVEARRYYDFYGYPPDYLKIYPEKIKAVTLGQVRAVLKKYFYPDKLIVMIVGNKNEMKDLSGLGAVTQKPLDND